MGVVGAEYRLSTWTSHGSRMLTWIYQCSFVYPYPSVSDLAGGNLDHGPRKTRTKTQTTPDSAFTRERRNSDHGLSFWGRKTQTMVGVFPVLGGGVDEGALNLGKIALIKNSRTVRSGFSKFRVAPLQNEIAPKSFPTRGRMADFRVQFLNSLYLWQCSPLPNANQNGKI